MNKFMAILFALLTIGFFGLSKLDSYQTRNQTPHGEPSGPVRTVEITPADKNGHIVFGMLCLVACIYFLVSIRHDSSRRSTTMTPQEAKAIAERWVVDTRGPNCAVLTSSWFEDHSYFVFKWNSRRYAETMDQRYSLLGPGPAIVRKLDGQVFAYGSNWNLGSLEKLLERQRIEDEQELFVRQRFPDYDIRKRYAVIVQEIYDPARLLALLASFELRYVIPEIETGVIWRIARKYDQESLQQRLRAPLPICFGGIGSHELHDLLLADETEKLCQFSIEAYQPREKPTYDPAKAKPDDLLPLW